MHDELSFSAIASQSMNFVRNRLWQIIFMCVLLAVFSTMLSNYFIDSNEIDELLATETGINSQFLFEVWKILIVSLITSLVTASVLVATIYNLSISHAINMRLLVTQMLPNILKIFGFDLLYAVISIFAGVALFTISAILPSSLGSMLTFVVCLLFAFFAMAMYYFFLGAIVEPTQRPFFQLFTQIHQLAKKHWRLAILVIIVRTIAALFIALITFNIEINLFMTILLSTLTNLVDFFVICFFYRLYTLLTKDSVLSHHNLV